MKDSEEFPFEKTGSHQETACGCGSTAGGQAAEEMADIQEQHSIRRCDLKQ
ncbi:hypothetical protein VSQ32_17700 [Lachnospiraceae bacterium KK002]